MGIGPAATIKRRISLSSGEYSSAIFRRRFARQGVAQQDNSDQDQRNAEQHPHGEPPPEEAELDVGLAKQFADDARDAVSRSESAGDEAGPLEAAAQPYQRCKHREQHDPFEPRLIELAGVA